MDCNPLYCASGAMGTAAFDQSFGSGSLPDESSIEYEGVYYKYQFETGQEETKHFAPVFTCAHSPDPLTKKLETYICVGMNSCLDGDGLKKHGGRPSLNLVLVVDISGSMDSPFSHDDPQVKLAVAGEAINSGLLPQLNANDRVSIVLFDDRADILQPMQSLGEIDIGELKTKVQGLRTRGGTTLCAGINAAEAQIKSLKDWNDKSRDNRIFFMTDMCPTTSSGDGKQMFATVKKLADEGVYTTVVGIGVDFNTDLTKHIGTIKACNYLCVQSAKEFKKMMNEQFDYLVTLNCVDTKITIASGDVQVERVFGSPGFEFPKDGVLCQMSSSYPSLKESPTLTQGGVMLVKLAAVPTTPLEFVVTYTGRKGGPQRDVYKFTVPPADKELYQGSAVRKAILLTRYTSLMKSFLIDSRNSAPKAPTPSFTGITAPPPASDASSTRRHTYASMQALTPAYRAVFETFEKYFTQEAELLSDKHLLDELKLVHKALDEKQATPAPTPDVYLAYPPDPLPPQQAPAQKGFFANLFGM